MKTNDDCCYEFGPFRLDPAEHTLSHDGHEIPLTPKAFDTLLVLVQEHGHLVTKDDLLDRVWPETHVEEANLAKHISMIRKVLSEAGLEKPVIDTVPKLGYRFVAPLTEIPLEDGNGHTQEQQTGSGRGAPSEQAVPGIRRLTDLAGRHRVATIVITVAVLLGVSGAAYYLAGNGGPPPLTDKDVILLTEFENRTGEDIFDGTLRQGLKMQLQQSPFLRIFPDEKVRAYLQMMKRPPDEPVTKEIGREICERRGLKALIAGTIVKLDRNYSLTLEAINAKTGDTIAITQAEAAGKDKVLSALSDLATQMRSDLGESLAQIERFDEPLPTVTTKSLEALKAFSMAHKLGMSFKIPEAIALYKRAVELDPEFTWAWFELGGAYSFAKQADLSMAAYKKAFDLRAKGKVTEQERLFLDYMYYQKMGDIPKTMEILNQTKELFPRNYGSFNNLAHLHNLVGDYEAAIIDSKAALEIEQTGFEPYGNLAWAYLRLDRLDESKEVVRDAFDRKFQIPGFHAVLYTIAFVENNRQKMQDEMAAISKGPEPHLALDLQAQSATFTGNWRGFRESSDKMIELVKMSGDKSSIAYYTEVMAFRASKFGRCAEALSSLEQGLQYEGKPMSKKGMRIAAYTLARCGKEDRAESMIANLQQLYATDTFLMEFWIPLIRAQIESNQGNPEQVIKTLDLVAKYEHSAGDAYDSTLAADFTPQYLRGKAFLALGEKRKAVAEFQKILDHRGESPMSINYPLAQLGKARALKNKTEYEKFFEMWKDADSELPILIEAKKEYRMLS